MLRKLERLLLLVGVLSLGYYVYVNVESALYQEYENRELDALLTTEPAPAPQGEPNNAPLPPARVTPARMSVVGRIEIPRLEVASIVRAGSDARTLRLAVGHIPGTALPGEPGNIGLAGHRDTFFRRLRDIHPDDEIRIATPDGTYVYRVARTDIVEPGDIGVLQPTSRPMLTLVTCYPFSYIGSAPQRFVVRAELIRAFRTKTTSS